MRPYLFELVLGGQVVRVPSYGVMLAVAFSAAYFASLKRAIRLGVDPRHIENLFLSIVFASVIGSRLFHVLFEELPYYLANPGKIVAIWEGGYTFYGAMLASILAVYLYCRWKKIAFLQFVDIAAPATALGLFFGRIGCFLAGCCWGAATSAPWAVTFSHPEAFTSAKHLAVHPSQLYESFAGLVIFLYLTWRFRDRRYVGQIFFEGLIAYGIARFIIEFFRGDEYRGYVLGGSLSYSQLVSLVLIPFAVVGMFLYSRNVSKRTSRKKAV